MSYYLTEDKTKPGPRRFGIARRSNDPNEWCQIMRNKDKKYAKTMIRRMNIQESKK